MSKHLSQRTPGRGWRGHRPLQPGQWRVQFLVVREVVVDDVNDEIQAELEAARKLSKRDRAAATDVRVVAGVRDDGSEYRPYRGARDNDESAPVVWGGIDRQWWADNNITD